MSKLLNNVALFSVAALALAGCSAGDSNASGSLDDSLKIVATTDVYGDIVKQVVGDKAEVTSIINSTSQDPHSYESTPNDRLTIKDADVVVYNGAGYDVFAEEMVGQDNPDQKGVNAVKLSGMISDDEYNELYEEHSQAHQEGEHTAHDHEFNEHMWYDLETMKKVADQVATDMGELDTANAQAYKKSAEEFDQKLDTIKASAKDSGAQDKKFVTTEPVPNYLLETAGMQNVTPENFVAAIDSDSDVAPLTMQEIKDLITAGNLDLVAYNEQTETSQTKEIRDTAENSSVATESFTETLPEGKDYVQWMTDNVENVKKAVA